MHNGMYTGRRPASLEELCVAQLKIFEPHVSLRNVKLLSQVADELKLDEFPLRELTGKHRPLIITLLAAHKNVLTVTVHTVDRNHDVQFRFLTNNAEDASHFVVHFLDKDASTFSHLPAERIPHPVKFF